MNRISNNNSDMVYINTHRCLVFWRRSCSWLNRYCCWRHNPYREDYIRVIAQLNEQSNYNSCGLYCHYNPKLVQGNIVKVPVLVRSTHKVCTIPGCITGVSEYDHDKCYNCATPEDMEYNYHHSFCNNKHKYRNGLLDRRFKGKI